MKGVKKNQKVRIIKAVKDQRVKLELKSIIDSNYNFFQSQNKTYEESSLSR